MVSNVTLEPRLTRDYRWGRLFDAARPHPSTLSVGVSELTALELGRGRPKVVGERSVTTLDARYARFLSASNGTFGMTNGLLRPRPAPLSASADAVSVRCRDRPVVAGGPRCSRFSMARAASYTR